MKQKASHWVPVSEGAPTNGDALQERRDAWGDLSPAPSVRLTSFLHQHHLWGNSRDAGRVSEQCGVTWVENVSRVSDLSQRNASLVSYTSDQCAGSNLHRHSFQFLYLKVWMHPLCPSINTHPSLYSHPESLHFKQALWSHNCRPCSLQLWCCLWLISEAIMVVQSCSCTYATVQFICKQIKT